MKQTAKSGNSVMDVATLSDAILNVNGKEMQRQQAQEIARWVLDYFGYEHRIISNIVLKDDVSMFYLLEDMDIVKPEVQMVPLYNGKPWRIIWWYLRKDRIAQYALHSVSEESEPRDALVYETLPDELWMCNHVPVV